MKHKCRRQKIVIAGIAAVVFGINACLGIQTSGKATYVLGVGWRGSLPTWQGPCDTTSQSGDSVKPISGQFYAVKPGITDFRCAKGLLRLEVRQPNRIAISPSPAVFEVHRKFILKAKVVENENELDLGNTNVTWKITPPLRATFGCNDITGSCVGSGSVSLVADTPGAFSVTARYNDLQATAVVKIIADK